MVHLPVPKNAAKVTSGSIYPFISAFRNLWKSLQIFSVLANIEVFRSVISFLTDTAQSTQKKSLKKDGSSSSAQKRRKSNLRLNLYIYFSFRNLCHIQCLFLANLYQADILIKGPSNHTSAKINSALGPSGAIGLSDLKYFYASQIEETLTL